MSRPLASALYAVVIPVYNEEECLPLLLQEYQATLDERFVIAIGLNASTDNSKNIAIKHDCLIGETLEKGYGHGCIAGINAVKKSLLPIDAYLFAAADGASDPKDLLSLVQRYEQGCDFAVGQRLFTPTGWCQLSLQQKVGNLVLGAWASLLSFYPWSDLGPTRLISKTLFERMDLQEWVWGWTIEAQIKAVHLNACITTIPVKERTRIAGQQKISNRGVVRSLIIAYEIMKAGYRSRFYHLDKVKK